MSINPHSIQLPADKVDRNYTPVGGRKYKVKTGDSWVLLAANCGVTPWALIRFNYPKLPRDLQHASREVNWYLQEYVGCTGLTVDQRNYVFTTTASPGEIWLPNAAAQPAPTPDAVVRRTVLATLRSPAGRRMNFGVGRIFIPASDYEMVAQAIDRNFIHVKANPALSNMAIYYSDSNLIEVAPGITDLGLIIHECTHAIFDLRKITTHVEETEGMAYVAQALYELIAYGPRPHYSVSVDLANPLSWVSWQLVFDESSRLAAKALTSYRLTDDDASLLFSAIRNTNWYGPRVGPAETNDGVTDEFYRATRKAL